MQLHTVCVIRKNELFKYRTYALSLGQKNPYLQFYFLKLQPLSAMIRMDLAQGQVEMSFKAKL